MRRRPVSMADWTEEEHKQAGILLMQRLGAILVVKLGADKRRRTRNTPGVPDTYFLHVRIPGGLWWEVKRVGGIPTPEQVDFERCCHETHTSCCIGTYEDLGRWLYDYGILQGPLLLSGMN